MVCSLSTIGIGLFFGRILLYGHGVLGSEQQPLSVGYPTTTLPDTSNLVFASLNGLLRSWSQVWAPNGHAVVPATIPKGSLLYHGSPAGTQPSDLDWFAFDAEHAYIFVDSSRGDSGGKLWTYAATRDLNVLYFDGFSASKGGGGTQDSQDVLVFGGASDNKTPGPMGGDRQRATWLCDWGKPLGVEGFVREEATFELIWCDFNEGVEVVSVLNITEPGIDTHFSLLTPHASEDPPRRPPPGRERKFTWYTAQTSWSFAHAAAWHHTVRDPRIVLHPEHMVSLYDPSYTSLAVNNQLPVYLHRLVDLSKEDLESFERELIIAVNSWKHGIKSGVDWLAIAQAIVDRYGDRLSELKKVLENGGNLTEQVITDVRRISFSLVMPYVPWKALHDDSTKKDRATAMREAEDRCNTAFTTHLNKGKFNKNELKLRRAVEGTLERICSLATTVLGESLNHIHLSSVDFNSTLLLEVWKAKVDALMDWLAWPQWKRCPRQCEWDEICYLPMWPLAPVPQINYSFPFPKQPSPEDLVPRCLNASYFLVNRK